jgi:hypothetical protein
MRFVGKVVYLEGETVEFEAGNVSLAAWERYAMRHKFPMGQDSPPTLSSLVMAHHALGIETAIDPWIATVDEIELTTKDAGGETADPPTPPAASTA